jgi:hypothetical protein
MFEHANGERPDADSYGNVQNKLSEICQSTQKDIRPETPRIFSDLVYLLRKLDADSMERIYRQISANTMCPNNHYRVRCVYIVYYSIYNTMCNNNHYMVM